MSSGPSAGRLIWLTPMQLIVPVGRPVENVKIFKTLISRTALVTAPVFTCSRAGSGHRGVSGHARPGLDGLDAQRDGALARAHRDVRGHERGPALARQRDPEFIGGYPRALGGLGARGDHDPEHGVRGRPRLEHHRPGPDRGVTDGRTADLAARLVLPGHRAVLVGRYLGVAVETAGLARDVGELQRVVGATAVAHADAARGGTPQPEPGLEAGRRARAAGDV